MNNTKYGIAEKLLQMKAIKLNAANPFTWASGWKSPIYCDNRLTLSFPKIRVSLRDAFVDYIKKLGEIDPSKYINEHRIKMEN